MINKDFYPTPQSLVHKMTANIENVKTILEPSAGKGDLVNHFLDRNIYRPINIDVIEIEEDLRTILNEKGFNVIHDDFLSFHSEKPYDLILANFPFSDGDAHMLKAIQLQEKYGGKIIALCNAETIRNPYSQQRKLLEYKLNEYEAEVEYLQNEFTNAERETNVEVALITLTVPEKKTKSVFIDHLKETEQETYSEYKHNQIVENNPISQLISRYNFEAKVGMTLISEYKKIKPLLSLSIQNSYPIIELSVKGDEIDDRLNFIKSLRKKYWRLFITGKQISGRYTSNVIEGLQKRLEDLEKKDFTKYNLLALQEELNRTISGDIDDTIISLFDKLSCQFSYNKSDYEKNVHMFNGWKTNKSWKINKKVIIPVNGYSSYSWKKDDLEYRYVTEQLNDIIKSLKYLDNNTELYDCSSLIESVKDDVLKHKNIELPYLTVSFYKKGTCHIVFTDTKLLDKLNIFGSQKKGWLPPSYGKAEYKDMTNVDKEIVDEFQGEEEYSKVLLEKDYYLEKKQFLMLN